MYKSIAMLIAICSVLAPIAIFYFYDGDNEAEARPPVPGYNNRHIEVICRSGSCLKTWCIDGYKFISSSDGGLAQVFKPNFSQGMNVPEQCQ